MFSDWTSADYFSNIASLVLFVVAYWLGRRQGQVIEDVSKLTADIHRLQEEVATMIAAQQFREKLGAMKQRAFEVHDNPSAAIILLTDSISILDGYRFASEILRREYAETLDKVFPLLCNRSNPYGEKRSLQLELALELVRHAKILFDEGERELAFSLMLPVANCALSVHKTRQSPAAGPFDLVTRELDTKAREKLEQLLSMSEPDLFRNLESDLFPDPGMETKVSGQATVP